VNRVEVLGGIRVTLIGEEGRKCGGSGADHSISIVRKVDDGTLDGSMAVLPKTHMAGLDGSLITDVHLRKR